MDDEQLRKEKYRCDYDGANGLKVGDLFFKASNPIYNRMVSLKKGEYILTELLDFADLKKSRLTGALGKFIDMGWIAVENPSIPNAPRIQTTQSYEKPVVVDAITELQAGLIKTENITNYAGTTRPSKSIDYPKESHPKIVETLSLDKSRKTNSLAISEIDSQSAPNVENEYTKFNSLRYFQKLKAIKETKNLSLLEMIASKSNYPQLIHNSKNRLRELQTNR